MTGGQPVGERPEGHSVLQIMKSLVSRRREEAGHRHRRAGEVRRRRRWRPASRCTTATSSTASSASCASCRAAPRIIYDQTCATEKRRRRKRGTLATPDKRVVINELVCEGCGDCSVQSNCLSRGAGGDRVRPQAPHQPEHLQQGLLLRQGLLPELRHGRGRAAEEAQEGKAAATWPRCRRCPSRCCRWPRRPGASWSAASAAPASSPSASCWAWPRTWKARAWSRRTPAAWRRRAAPPGATSRSPTGADAIYTTKVDTAKADLVIGCDPIVGATQVHAGGDAAGPHLRGAQHPRHAHRGLRAATPTGSSPAASCEAAVRASVGDGARRRLRRRAGGAAAAGRHRSTPTR